MVATARSGFYKFYDILIVLVISMARYPEIQNMQCEGYTAISIYTRHRSHLVHVVSPRFAFSTSSYNVTVLDVVFCISILFLRRFGLPIVNICVPEPIAFPSRAFLNPLRFSLPFYLSRSPAFPPTLYLSVRFV